MMHEEQDESFDRFDDWVYEEESHTFQIAVLRICLAFSVFVIGLHVGATYLGPPAPIYTRLLQFNEPSHLLLGDVRTSPVIRAMHLGVVDPDRNGITCSMISIGVDHGVVLKGIEVVGNPNIAEMIRNHKLMPRCRDVPEGAGCFDWLESGEKEFPKRRKQ